MFEDYNENLQYGNVSYGGGLPILPIIIIALIAAIAFALIKSKKLDVTKAKNFVSEAKRTIEEKTIITEKKIEPKRAPVVERKIPSEPKVEVVEKPKTEEPKKDDWFKSAGDL